MKIKQLRPCEVTEEKQELILSQLQRCALCRRPIKLDSSTHLDHCHQSGRVRGALCRACNTFEGIIHHKFVRSGLKGQGVNYTDWLVSLSEYLTADYSNNNYHPQHMADQTSIFSRLTIGEQKLHLDSLGVKYPLKAKKADLEKIYKRSFLQNPRVDFDNGKYDTLEIEKDLN